MFKKSRGQFYIILFSFSRFQSEIPAQQLNFGLWRSQFKKKMKFGLHTIQLSP